MVRGIWGIEWWTENHTGGELAAGKLWDSYNPGILKSWVNYSFYLYIPVHVSVFFRVALRKMTYFLLFVGDSSTDCQDWHSTPLGQSSHQSALDRHRQGSPSGNLSQVIIKVKVWELNYSYKVPAFHFMHFLQHSWLYLNVQWSWWLNWLIQDV